MDMRIFTNRLDLNLTVMDFVGFIVLLSWAEGASKIIL